MAFLKSRYAFILFLTALVIYPLVAPKYYTYIVNIIMIYVIASLGLNLLMGYTGQISLANAAFFGIGAYASAILCAKTGAPFWISIPFAGFLTGFLGFLLGLPALRLRGHYLALATIGFGEITQLVIIHWGTLTEGPQGMAVPPASLFGFQFNSMARIYFVILTITLLFYYAYRNIIDSRVGRAFMTIRDSEVASESIGVNQALYKSIAFILSAFYAGVAGALYSITVGWLDPENFGLMESINHLTYVIVGGMATLGGPVIGAAAFTLLPELLREFKENNTLINAFFLLIFIVFLPGGMVKLLSQWMPKFFKSSSKRKRENS